MRPENVMKSLATTFLIFVTCIVVAGTNALIDRAQVTLAASPGGNMQVGANVTDAGNAITLAKFARTAQEKFRLVQPTYPIAFDDLRPNDPDYAAAQAVYPFLHRQLLCPECALDSRFSPQTALTRAQAAVVLVSVLTARERISLLSPEQTADALADVPDAESVSAFARPYIATAVAAGILTLDTSNMIRPAQPYSRTEMNTAFETIQRRFPPSTATAALHLAGEAGR
jgi:S-layer homology domain